VGERVGGGIEWLSVQAQSAMVDVPAIVKPLLLQIPRAEELLDRLPGTEEHKLAVVAGGAAVSVATLCCVCATIGRTPTTADAAATVTSGDTATTATNSPADSTPAKERKRPAPLETGTPGSFSSPRGRPSPEAVAEMLGRRQQVLDEIVAVDEECVEQLQALDKHFVGEPPRESCHAHHSALGAL